MFMEKVFKAIAKYNNGNFYYNDYGVVAETNLGKLEAAIDEDGLMYVYVYTDCGINAYRFDVHYDKGIDDFIDVSSIIACNYVDPECQEDVAENREEYNYYCTYISNVIEEAIKELF